MTRFLSAFALLALLLTGLAPAASAQAEGEIVCSDDRNEKAIHYTLYYESFKAEDYETARPDLEWLLECDPTFTGVTPGDRNLRRAVVLYDSLAMRSDDPAQQQAYLASALAVLDEAPSILQDAGVEAEAYDYMIRKGRFIQRHPDLLADQQGMIFDLYLQAFETAPDSLGDYYINYLASGSAIRANQTDTPEAKAEARDFITGQLQPQAEDPSYIQDTILPTIITTPREQYEFLVGRFRDDPTSVGDEDLNTLYNLNKIDELATQNPDLNDLLIAELLTRDPNPRLLMTVAAAAAAKEDYEEAERRYMEAMEMGQSMDATDDPMVERDINYGMAVMKEQQGQRGTAAGYARSALELDSGHAQSAYLLGTLMQSSVRGGDARGKAGYWCAADQFSRAASIAASNGNDGLAADARRAAGNAANAGPSAEEYFFLDWQPGQTVSASYGWGSCSTRVR
ncbi:MAG: hypothetical protein AAGI91_16465 [Bacteroidota bacterium]